MNVNELEKMRALEVVFEDVNDPAMRNRILAWANSRFGEPHRADVSKSPSATLKNKAQVGARTVSTTSRNKTTFSLVKDLDTRPPGKKSLASLVEEKRPNSFEEKCTTVIYFLQFEAGIAPISVSHVYTCFKGLGWRVPADLINALQRAGSRGWLDTKNRESIRLTPLGENAVEHDLPRSGSRK